MPLTLTKNLYVMSAADVQSVYSDYGNLVLLILSLLN